MNQSAAHQARGDKLPPEPQPGELGRLIEAWADGQRFRPTQREIARELKVSPQLVNNWIHGNYKSMLKPVDVKRISRLLTGPGESEAEVFEEVLAAILRDTGHLPPGKRLRGR